MLYDSRMAMGIEVGVAGRLHATPSTICDSWRDVPHSWHVMKRAMDVILAIFFLIVATPVLVVAMIAIVASSPGWPMFMQERVGRYGRRFTMLKLRTMVKNAEEKQHTLLGLNEAGGPVFKIRNDPRIFPVGAFFRKTSIDEIPNLFNVLLGHMSIVGPRPPLPDEVENYGDFALRRLRVKPGVTCFWQISGRSNIDFSEWMALDNLYIDTWSPIVDMKIMLRTIPAVLFCRGAY